MLSKLRERTQGDSGFTLVELLVVMLILGLLAAIAIPAFFNQRDKAHDADAKATVHSAQVALETYATDHNGSYVGATVTGNPDSLDVIEPTLTTNEANIDIGTPTDKTYTITVTANSTGNTFSLTRAANGAETVTCTTLGSGGCPSDGNWGP